MCVLFVFFVCVFFACSRLNKKRIKKLRSQRNENKMVRKHVILFILPPLSFVLLNELQ